MSYPRCTRSATRLVKNLTNLVDAACFFHASTAHVIPSDPDRVTDAGLREAVRHLARHRQVLDREIRKIQTELIEAASDADACVGEGLTITEALNALRTMHYREDWPQAEEAMEDEPRTDGWQAESEVGRNWRANTWWSQECHCRDCKR